MTLSLAQQRCLFFPSRCWRCHYSFAFVLQAEGALRPEVICIYGVVWE